MPNFDRDWFLENALSELIFGFLIAGLLAFFWRYIRDAWRAVRVARIISIHNNPSRTRRSGVYARDRFMMIYETGKPLPSGNECMWGNGEGGGIWINRVIDKDILEHHNLVKIENTPQGSTVEIREGRVSPWVYKICKFLENSEEKRTEAFIQDKTGKLRKIPKH